MELSTLSDTELLTRIREDDADALEVLLGRHYKLVHGVAFRLSGSSSDAQDITQDVLVRAARSIRSFQGKSKFSTWLYRIATNAAYDFGKRKGREARLKQAATEDYELNKVVGNNEDLSKTIQAALVKLSDKEREAVVLTFYEGLTHAEVAQILGCAETTVSWRVFTAKRKLKHLLKF